MWATQTDKCPNKSKFKDKMLDKKFSRGTKKIATEFQLNEKVESQWMH